MKKFCIVVNFFIWIVIKNYWCDIKSEKSGNVLMLISSEKYKKKWKKSTWTVLFCIVAWQTSLRQDKDVAICETSSSGTMYDSSLLLCVFHTIKWYVLSLDDYVRGF